MSLNTRGLYPEQFYDLLAKVEPLICQPRTAANVGRVTQTMMTTETRLVMVLNWLREGGTYRRLARLYGVNKAFVSREIHHIIPLLYATLDEIQRPSRWPTYSFFTVKIAGAIDCTAHFRNRVHPKQANYYRRDKRGFLLTAQVVTSLEGVLLDVHFALGHNNDQGTYALTGMRAFLQGNGLKLLADGGYKDVVSLVCPDDKKGRSWNNQQKALRSVVEVAIGMVQHYSYAAQKAQQTPELQALALMCCYQLANINLKRFPLRQLPPPSSAISLVED
ncbi:DDE Tnp4 domain-containing protein [Balamuthia mandrillaris]